VDISGGIRYFSAAEAQSGQQNLDWGTFKNYRFLSYF